MVERTLISFPSQLQLIERLQNLLYLSSSMVFISGEKGSGKSTLVEQLSNQLPDKTQQAFISLVEPTPIAQLRLKIISQLFTQPLFDADDSLFNSLLLLKDKQTATTARVVVIDNVELLPEPLIDELAEVITKKSLLTDNEINFILVGDEIKNNQLINQIKQSPENLSIAALSFKLPPLAINEAQKLLSHSLGQVSYSPKVQHQDALARQLANCQGIPEKILLLATEISSGNFEEDKPSFIKTRLPAIVFMFGLVAIATSLALYLYPKFIKPEVNSEVTIEHEAFFLDEITSTNLMTDEHSVAESTEVLAGQWSKDKKAITDTKLIVGEDDIAERVTITDSQLYEMSQSGSLATIDNGETKPEALLKTEAITALETELKNVEASLSDEVSASSATSIADQEEIPNNEGQNGDITATEQEPELDTEPAIDINQTEPKEINSDVVQPAQAESSLINQDVFTDIDVLLEIDPELYTLQLSGLSSEQSLQAFVEKYQLPQKDVYLYKTIRNGDAWYVIIYGQFESRSLAIQAAKNRPTIINKLDTWAKKYATVHQDLTLNEQ